MTAHPITQAGRGVSRAADSAAAPKRPGIHVPAAVPRNPRFPEERP